MSAIHSLIAELKQEAANSRKLLERVPMEKRDWKPHEKSMSIGRLATHIAETIHWISVILGAERFDIAANPAPVRHVAADTDELLRILNHNLEQAVRSLSAATTDDLEKDWIMMRGDQEIMRSPKIAAIRGWGISHQIHHRGQLSVFLRLLNVPVPGVYGPSADER
jgi:uncharacterized damage-inducible protein DinB